MQGSITIAVEEQSIFTQEITQSIAQTLLNTNAISDSIENVATNAKTNQEGVVKVNQASAELSAMAVVLEDLVARFQVSSAESVKRVA